MACYFICSNCGFMYDGSRSYLVFIRELFPHFVFWLCPKPVFTSVRIKGKGQCQHFVHSQKRLSAPSPIAPLGFFVALASNCLIEMKHHDQSPSVCMHCPLQRYPESVVFCNVAQKRRLLGASMLTLYYCSWWCLMQLLLDFSVDYTAFSTNVL